MTREQPWARVITPPPLAGIYCGVSNIRNDFHAFGKHDVLHMGHAVVWCNQHEPQSPFLFFPQFRDATHVCMSHSRESSSQRPNTCITCKVTCIIIRLSREHDNGHVTDKLEEPGSAGLEPHSISSNSFLLFVRHTLAPLQVFIKNTLLLYFTCIPTH